MSIYLFIIFLHNWNVNQLSTIHLQSVFEFGIKMICNFIFNDF